MTKLRNAVLLLSLFTAGTATAQAIHQSYRVSGSPALRPAKIWDDGRQTYIVWSPEVELPAVFSIGSDGREVITDGQMRNGQYVLDRVHSTLVFRIDRASASAKRKSKP